MSQTEARMCANMNVSYYLISGHTPNRNANPTHNHNAVTPLAKNKT